MDFGNAADFLRQNQILILLCVGALSIVVFTLNLYLIIKVRRLSRKALGVVDGETGRQLRDEITEHAETLSAMCGDFKSAQQEQLDLKKRQKSCIQRVGFVRFDAFEDVGGEQSFALALLDDDYNGIVISSLLSRVDSRMYAKSITAGGSEHNLSKEEQQAVRKAAER